MIRVTALLLIGLPQGASSCGCGRRASPFEEYNERDAEGDSVHAIMRGGSESGITPWLRAVTASSR